MADKNVELIVSVQTKQAEQNVDKLNKKLNNTKKDVEEINDVVGKEGTSAVSNWGNAFEGAFSVIDRGTSQADGNIKQVVNTVKNAIPVVKKINSTALSGLTGIKAALAAIPLMGLITGLTFITTKLVEFVKQTREAKTQLANLNLEIEKSASGAASQIVALTSLATKYREVGDNADDKKKFLEEYRKEIEKTGIAVGDVNTADDVFINKTGDYIEALKKRAKGQGAYNLAVQKTQEYLEGLPVYEKKIEEAQKDVEAATQVQGSYAESARAMTQQNLQAAQRDLENYTNQYNSTLDRLMKISADASDTIVSAVTGSVSGSVNYTAQQVYDAWAKTHEAEVIAGNLAVEQWEAQIKKEGELARTLARIRSSVYPVSEEEVSELTPQEYLTKLFENKNAGFQHRKELLDIEVLSAREKNNKLYNLELERLDAEATYLQQMYDLELEGSKKREELEEKIANNKQQRNLVEHQAFEQRRKDMAEEVAMYASAAQSIASIFATIAQAEEERIQRMVENNEISEEQAKEMFETVKSWQYAETWINTLAGMTAALTAPVMQSSGPPGWIAAAAQAASILATGIAQTIKIKNTQFGSGPSGGGGNGGMAGATPLQVMNDITPSPTMNIPVSSEDTRVYILESDIQKSNNRVKVREDNTTW